MVDIAEEKCYPYHRGGVMAVSYKRLWKLLIDRDMKKKDLQKLSGVSSSSIAKLGRNETVTTEVLEKICVALSCELGDIAEICCESQESVGNRT